MKKHASIPTILGENFRKAREELGLSVADLASMATLSPSHIEQIENGGYQSFYTLAIKVQGARKVAKILGLTDEEAFKLRQVDQDQQISFELPEIEQSKSENIFEVKPKDLLELEAAIDSDKNESSKVKKKLDKELKKVSSIDSHLKEVVTTFQTDKDQKRNQVILICKFLLYLLIALALILLVIKFNHQDKKSVNQSPVTPSAPFTEIQDQGLEKKGQELAEVTTAPTSQATAPQEASKSLAKVTSIFPECTRLLSNAEKYTPALASKTGNQVYVLSKTETTICFEDADGNQQKRDLSQNIGTTFYGKAPLKLGSNNLDQFDIFYQGYKVKADLSERGITLIERSID